jgi:uncharacterized protein YndB with AHSA1/START domain
VTDRHVLHATFTLEPSYPAPLSRVFAAWADPAAKARWFAGPDAEHALDFRVGGRETAYRPADGNQPALKFESVYHDIVPDERIVYSSTLSAGDQLATVSLTTVQFRSSAEGTQLVLTEQGTFLDGYEDPRWREEGTGQQLTALAAELAEGTEP